MRPLLLGTAISLSLAAPLAIAAESGLGLDAGAAAAVEAAQATTPDGLEVTAHRQPSDSYTAGASSASTGLDLTLRQKIGRAHG